MGHVADPETKANPRARVSYRRAIPGYVICAILGGAYVSFWFRHGIMPDEDFGAWEGFVKNLWLFVPIALVCCLPTFQLLRRVLYKKERETPLAIALMWAACATGVFVLFLFPELNHLPDLTYMVMLTTAPGAAIGLVYYWIEQPKRTAQA